MERTVNRRRFLGAAAGGLAALGMPRGVFSKAAKEKLNFVFILVDDMGWMDTSTYGSNFYESPNVTRLAEQGMKFTDAYAACPVCSPTRASFMTGKYPATVNLTDFIPGHWRPYAKLVVPEFNQSLSLDEVTIAEALRTERYVSTMIGKWHLGRFRPKEHGFDEEFMGGQSEEDKRVGVFTRRALDFMERNRNNPFFLFLSHHTVHIPLEAKQEIVEKYEGRLTPDHKQRNATYAAMIEVLDDSVGTLMKKLEELNIADRTVVIFTSDNGGLIKIYTGRPPVVTSNAPLRSEKGTLYEGGIRVPLIVRWPGVVNPGTVCDEPVTTADFYPTMTEIAGARPDAEHRPDGKSLVPLLKETGAFERDAIYWHYPHYHHTAPCGAVRSGDYKLIEFYEDGKLELYNLKDDIGEKKNLADAMPKRAAELRRMLHTWREKVGAKMPSPNPEYDPARAHEWGNRRKMMQQRKARGEEKKR